MAANRWFFPTNTENLKTILAHGLICGPAGYKKYYSDISCSFFGFIPIFCNGNDGHKKALTKAREEDANLDLCLLEINLNQIQAGKVYLTDSSPVDIEQCHDPSFGTICIPAPLPLSCVKQVIFCDSKTKYTFTDDIKSYGDTPQDALKMVVAKKPEQKLFKEAEQTGMLGDSKETEAEPSFSAQYTCSTHQNYKNIYSFGGSLCTLFYFAKNGATTNSALGDCTKIKKLENYVENDEPITFESLLCCLNNYFYHKTGHTKKNVPQFIILDSVLDSLVEQEKNEHITSIVNFLNSADVFDKEEEKSRAKELSKRLTDFYNNKIDSKASTLFSTSRSRVEKILLLLAYRDDVAGLLETDIAKLEVFDEEDYIIAAILFGARSKYHKIPISLRQYPGIQGYMSYLMAQFAHTTGNTGITFKKPPIPLTIMEMVDPRRREQSKKLGFIYWLSNKYTKLQNCFETIMPNKKFANDNGKSTYDGVVLPEINIKEQEYFKVMSKIKVDDEAYETILKKYKSA